MLHGSVSIVLRSEQYNHNGLWLGVLVCLYLYYIAMGPQLAATATTTAAAAADGGGGGDHVK